MKQDLQQFFITYNVFKQLGIDRINVFVIFSTGIGAKNTDTINT